MNDRPLVSLDLEMTSPRPENQEIIEIAAVKFQGPRVLQVFSTLVQPPVPLPFNIQVLTGIKPPDLVRAPRLEAVAQRLVAFIGDAPLVAHSVGSDVGVLARKGIVLANDQIDTFELASILLPQLESYSLAALVRYFGIPQTREHRALPDAHVTRQLYARLIERAEQLDLAVLREILSLTSGLMWPLRRIFEAAEAARSRPASSGSTIRDVLAAKLGAGEASLDAVLTREQVEPLRPTTTVQTIDVDRVASAIGASGAIARTIEGYEERPQQVEMLRAIAETFNDGGELVVEAGTGTGKSMAYLIPAIEFARRNRARVVVSTNTINLQEQLYLKDIPALRRALGDGFRATLLKGRQNYLCFQRWGALRRRPDLTMAEILTLVKILVWLPQTESGDVGELNLIDAERQVWTKVNANAELCSPRRCAAAGKRGCFLQYARESAAGSHIVIVNHALLLSDVAAGGGVLPDYDYLVIDEAHHLEAQATDQLAYTVRLRDIIEILDSLAHTTVERRSGVLNELSSHFRGSRVSQSGQREAERHAREVSAALEPARAAATAFFGAVGSALKPTGGDGRGQDQRARLTPALRRAPTWQPVDRTWEDLAIALAGARGPIERLLTLVATFEGEGVAEWESLIGTLSQAQRFLDDLAREGAAIVVSPDPERIYWATVNGAETSLHTAPLRVGPILRQSLFDQKRATVLTSATLTTDREFDYVRERLDLAAARELQVGSPFDYASSTLLYLPTDVPEPNRPEYAAALAASLIELCIASDGRALILFTSHSQLRQTWQAIKRPLEARGILVLAHAVDGTSRRHLLQSFKATPRSVLLGASSFWEGVDVIGDGLSVLAIAKLPFAVPTDPIVAARSELFQDPFNEYSVPTTILKLKQGFGRLIRSRTDRGIVVCYDRRLLSKGYGASFLRSLPPATVRRDTLAALPPAAAAWLKPPS